MRELSTIKIGCLINGQVVRTHPVHPQDKPGQEGVLQHHQLFISHHPRQRGIALLEFLKCVQCVKYGKVTLSKANLDSLYYLYTARLSLP